VAKDGPGGEKTEAPTPQRLKKARKDGQIARSPELGTWLGVLVASVMVPRMAASGIEEAQELVLHIGQIAERPDPAAAAAVLGSALWVFVMVTLPLAMAMLVTGVAASAAQGGVHWSNKPVAPNPKKLNPVPGIKRMFGPQGLWEVVKALIKTAALAVVIWLTAGTARELVTASGALPLSAIISTVGDSAVRMLQVTALTGLVLAAADYMVVKRRMIKQLRMTKYEIMQEYKQQEGDPHVKAQRRSIQQQMSGNRMMAAVADADVLLVNPTHVAVALAYDPAKGGAPVVLAKGAGAVAAKLRERAAEERVPMVQDIPLTRALHASCEIGQTVPTQLFTAVARVLAFVMQLKARGVAAGMHRPGFPAPDTSDLPRARRRR
jgi:flagellar biosynthetic protein FlhB